MIAEGRWWLGSRKTRVPAEINLISTVHSSSVQFVLPGLMQSSRSLEVLNKPPNRIAQPIPD